MALYKGETLLAGSGAGFMPENEGTTGQVLKKTETGYRWNDLAEGGEEGQILMKTEDGYARCDAPGGVKYGYVDVLIVGGGGAGGYVSCGYTNCPDSAGGGGGGVIQCLHYPITNSSDSIAICVGKGGFAGTDYSTGCCGKSESGDNSSFGQLIAYGGGRGGAVNMYACNGGSGGGRGSMSSVNGKGTCGQGHDGGNTIFQSGGGGAGAPGSIVNGGIGIQSDLTGTMLYYGGGGSYRTGTQPEGSAACGCYGGGGAGQCNPAGTRNILGCQGIVVIRYHTNGSDGIKNTSSGGCKYTCGDYTIHCFPDIGQQYFVPVFK